MSKTIRVVGVDPSMSNFGLAIGTLDLETDKLDIHGLTLVETKAGGNKKTVRVNSCQQRVKSDPLTATTNGLILIHLVYSGLASA
ncbi:hypothetical protein ACSB4A_004382, partial [Enterobacter hormaechei]